MKFDYIERHESKRDKKLGKVIETNKESIIMDDKTVEAISKIVNNFVDKVLDKIDTYKICDTINAVYKSISK